jgi:tetratricopeptide (TPR) repeat protein
LFVASTLYSKTNEPEKTIQFIKACLVDNPDAHLHRLLGLVCHDRDNETSLTHLNLAIKYDPKNTTRLLFFKARCMHFEDYDFEKVIACYQEYLDSNPIDDPYVCDAYYAICALYMVNKNAEKGKLFWDKAVESEKYRLECFYPEFSLQIGSDYPEREDVIYQLAKAFMETNLYLCCNCGKPNPKFRCPCMKEAYCGEICQSLCWEHHKNDCKKNGKNKEEKKSVKKNDKKRFKKSDVQFEQMKNRLKRKNKK